MRHARAGEVRTIVKIGGGLMAGVSALPTVLEAIDAARGRGLMIVPGGGPFADAVRAASATIPLGDDAAHWMAVLAMDQYAHLIASQLPGAMVVTAPHEARPALASRMVPVLAPYQWLRRCDPLPHSWNVTSDSIAAWIADVTGASRLLLVKPPGARGDALVDAYFRRLLRTGLEWSAVAADDTAGLRAALRA